jgi:Tetratricopeptide repeat.
LPPLEFQPGAPPLALLVELSEEVEAERLEETRAALAALLKRMPVRPVSLWVYGARAWRVMPATEDLHLLQRLVDSLSPSLLPSGGRSLASVLAQVAASQARRGAPGEILVVAHGAGDAAVERAAGLAGEGFRVHILDLGEKSSVLRQVAEAGQGGYYRDERIGELVLALEPRHYRAAESTGEPLPVDNGPWLLPLLLGVVFLLFRRGVAPLCLLLLVLPPVPVEAGWMDLFLTPDQQGWRALQQGNPRAAVRHFSDPLWRGIALYHAGDYAAAARLFGEVNTAMALYNRGNALVRLGDLEGARDAYRAALVRDPDLVDAGYNLQLVEQVLAEESAGDGGGMPRLTPREETRGARQDREVPEPAPGAGRSPSQEHGGPGEARASREGVLSQAPEAGSPDQEGEGGLAGQVPEPGADRAGKEDSRARRERALSTAPGTAAVPRQPGLAREGRPAGVPRAGEQQGTGESAGIEAEEGDEGKGGSPGRGSTRDALPAGGGNGPRRSVPPRCG